MPFCREMWYKTGMELGILWLITAVVSAGIMGPLATAWGLKLRALDLERRVTRLEENRQSDMQREKANKRWSNKQIEEELLAGARNGSTPQQDLPWWAQRG